MILSRKRGCHTAPVDDELVCNDPGCETLVSNVDLLRCDSPGCYLVYHLTCRGLIEKPSGGWFCDDECKRNAGFRVGGRKRRRRVAGEEIKENGE